MLKYSTPVYCACVLFYAVTISAFTIQVCDEDDVDDNNTLTLNLQYKKWAHPNTHILRQSSHYGGHFDV